MYHYKNKDLDVIASKLVVIFTFLQVFLDLSATISVKVLNTGFNLALVFRGLFLLLAFVYLVIRGRNIWTKIFPILISLFFSLNVFIYSRIYSKSLFSQFPYLFKTLFFSIGLLFVVVLMKNINEKSTKELQLFSMKITRAFVINTFIYSLIIILGFIFGFGFRTYNINDPRIGSIGLFLSGNEMGAYMLSLGCFSVLSLKYNHSNKFTHISIWMVIVSTLIIGTKSAGIISIVLLIFYSFILLKRIKISVLKVLVIFSIFIVAFLNTPSFLNFRIQKEMQNKDIYYSALEKTDVIEEEDIKRFEENETIVTNELISSISFKQNEDKIVISGYAYPKYFELGHPNFISMKLNLKTLEKNKVVELKNIYNKHVQNDKEIEFSSRFSGVSGEINKEEFLELFSEGVVPTLEVDYKNESYTFDIIDELTFSQVNNEIIVKKGNVLTTENAELMNTGNTNHSNENGKNESHDPKNVISFILSGRNNRINKYMNETGSFNFIEILFGKGPIPYNSTVFHFEMDFLEVFATFGIVGFILQFTLFLYLILIIIINLYKIFAKTRSLDIFLYLKILVLLISTLIGFFAGHVFLNPRVSFGLIIIVSTLFWETNNKMENLEVKINEVI